MEYKGGEESGKMLRFGVKETGKLEPWKSARQTLRVCVGSGIWTQ